MEGKALLLDLTPTPEDIELVLDVNQRSDTVSLSGTCHDGSALRSEGQLFLGAEEWDEIGACELICPLPEVEARRSHSLLSLKLKLSLLAGAILSIPLLSLYLSATLMEGGEAALDLYTVS